MCEETSQCLCPSFTTLQEYPMFLNMATTKHFTCAKQQAENFTFTLFPQQPYQVDIPTLITDYGTKVKRSKEMLKGTVISHTLKIFPQWLIPHVCLLQWPLNNNSEIHIFICLQWICLYLGQSPDSMKSVRGSVFRGATKGRDKGHSPPSCCYLLPKTILSHSSYLARIWGDPYRTEWQQPQNYPFSLQAQF